MVMINLDKIDTIRRFPVDINDDDKDEQESGQLISPFEGRFYIKFADNQYKPFDQEVGQDTPDKKTEAAKIRGKLSTIAQSDLYVVDYARTKSLKETEADIKRLEIAIVELFKDVTQLHSNQMELDEISEEDLYGDDE